MGGQGAWPLAWRTCWLRGASASLEWGTGESETRGARALWCGRASRGNTEGRRDSGPWVGLAQETGAGETLLGFAGGNGRIDRVLQ